MRSIRIVKPGTSKNTAEIIPIRCLLEYMAFSNAVMQFVPVQLYVVRIDVQIGADVCATSV